MRSPFSQVSVPAVKYILGRVESRRDAVQVQHVSIRHCGAAQWGGGSRELAGQCMYRKVRSTEDAFQAVNDAGMQMHNQGKN